MVCPSLTPKALTFTTCPSPPPPPDQPGGFRANVQLPPPPPAPTTSTFAVVIPVGTTKLPLDVNVRRVGVYGELTARLKFCAAGTVPPAEEVNDTLPV